jgi:hypothetical protein
VRLSGDTAYVVATPSVFVYAAFDDDKNGRLHVEEVARHREALLARFDETFLVNEGKPERRRVAFSRPENRGAGGRASRMA